MNVVAAMRKAIPHSTSINCSFSVIHPVRSEVKKANRLAVERDVVQKTIHGRAGNRVVVQLYLLIVVIAGVMGLILGTISPRGLDPELFFVFELPPTPVGVAIYGAVTVGVILGILLALVVYVSHRYADTEDTNTEP